MPRRVAVLSFLLALLASSAAFAQKGDDDLGPRKRDQRDNKKKPAKASGKAYLLERVVAVVNDAIILASELDVRLLPMLPDLEGIEDEGERMRRLEKLRLQTLEDMINEELIVQAAAEAKIEVEPKEVDAALAEIKQQNKLSDADFEEAVAAQGFTMSAYKADLRRQLTRLKAVNALVRERVSVTDEDVRARYDALVRRSESVRAVRLSHILSAVPEKASDSVLAAAKEKAASAVQRIRAGEDFALVAADLSDDASTASGGGELGWIERGSLSPEWETIIFAMEENEVRGPVNGPQGLHVFFVQEVKRTEIKPFEELKDQIKTELIRRGMEKQTALFIEELRRKAYVDNKL
jgi:parvulin-like peptidyl-prolyl isomerase